MPTEEIAIGPAWLNYFPDFLQAKLKNRRNLHRVISNVVWLFFDKILRMGVGLLVGVWVARYLGPTKFGLLSYSLAFVTMFSAIASLGLDSIVVRNIVREPGARDEILGTALVLKLLGAFIAVALSVMVICVMHPGDMLTCWLVAIIALGMIFQSLDTIDLWFQSQVNSKYTVYARNAAFILISAIKIGLIVSEAPLIAFACAGLAETVVAAIGLVMVYIMNGYSFASWRLSLSRGKSLFKDSWPLLFSGIVVLIYLRIDQVMIGEMLGNAEVGIYSAAVRLAEVWYFIPMAICASVFPSIVEAKSVSETLFYSRLQKLYNLMSVLGYIVAIPITFISGWLVQKLFGPEFAKAGPMLSLLIWAGMFVNLGVARSSFLTTMNWTRLYFMTVFIGSLINVVLNLFLIPRYGGMGAVVASCIAYWFAAHGSCFFYKPLRRTGYMLTRALLCPQISLS